MESKVGEWRLRAKVREWMAKLASGGQGLLERGQGLASGEGLGLGYTYLFFVGTVEALLPVVGLWKWLATGME